jgi:hypothetical protein
MLHLVQHRSFAQEVLGYAAHDAIADLGGYLGTVELRDPVDLIAEGLL